MKRQQQCVCMAVSIQVQVITLMGTIRLPLLLQPALCLLCADAPACFDISTSSAAPCQAPPPVCKMVHVCHASLDTMLITLWLSQRKHQRAAIWWSSEECRWHSCVGHFAQVRKLYQHISTQLCNALHMYKVVAESCVQLCRAAYSVR